MSWLWRIIQLLQNDVVEDTGRKRIYQQFLEHIYEVWSATVQMQNAGEGYPP